MKALLNTHINIIPIIFTIIVGAVIYANSLGNGFVWDDETQIVQNSVIQNLNNIPYIFSGSTFTTGGGGLSGWFFRPLLTFTFMLNFLIFGPSPAGYHLFQVAFHIINAVLIFKILNHLGGGRLERSESHDSPEVEGAVSLRHTWCVKLVIHVLIAILFVVHPAITEAVAYISALSEVMYTFFALLGFYLIVKTAKIGWKQLIFISFLFFISLLYKESALVIFPIIISFMLIFRHPYWKRNILSIFLPLLAYSIVRFVLIGTPLKSPQFAPISEAPVSVRLLTLPLEFVSYLRVVLFPKDLAISQHFLVQAPNREFFIPLAITIILFTLTILLYKISKSKLVLLGVVWFLLGFAFISNLFPLDMTIAERWLYFPFIGLLFILAGILEHLEPRKVVIILIIIITPLLGLRTIFRNKNWHDGLTLYSHDIKISRNSFDLENNLGVELFRAGRYTEAQKHFERSITLQPKWHFAYNNLGAVYEREGNLPKAKELYLKTLTLSDYFLAYENAAFLILKQGDAKEAKDFSEKALKKLPNNPKLWLTLGLSYYKLGDKTNALLSVRQSVILAPSDINYYVLDRLTQDKPIEMEGF